MIIATGADEICGVVLGDKASNALTFGHYDYSGRFQTWGVVISSSRTKSDWAATGRAFHLTLQWMRHNRQALRNIFPDMHIFNTFDGILDEQTHTLTPPSDDLTPHLYSCERYGNMNVTFAFPIIELQDRSEEVFAVDSSGVLNIQMVRDGGIAIDGFFETWPGCTQKYESIMCHHHDAAIMKKVGGKEIQKLALKNRRERSLAAKKMGGTEICPEMQQFWDALQSHWNHTTKGCKDYWQKLWTEIFGGIYEGWIHTPYKQRKVAFLNVAGTAMVDMGLLELKSFVFDRYMSESSYLGKICRSDLAFKEGNLDNGGNEGGVNKRLRNCLENKSHTMDTLVKLLLNFLESEGRSEFRRGGVLLSPDPTNAGNTCYNNNWNERRGNHPKSAWEDAVGILTNYYYGTNSPQKKWLGIEIKRIGSSMCHVVPCRSVRKYAKDRIEYLEHAALKSATHAPLEARFLSRSDAHVEALKDEYQNVYECWNSFFSDPGQFGLHVIDEAFKRSPDESKEYWGSEEVQRNHRVDIWKEIFREMLFYDGAYCVCMPYAEDDSMLPEIWRPTDSNSKPVHYRRFKGDCKRCCMHRYCGCTLAVGLWHGYFEHPNQYDNNKLVNAAAVKCRNKCVCECNDYLFMDC